MLHVQGLIDLSDFQKKHVDSCIYLFILLKTWRMGSRGEEQVHGGKEGEQNPKSEGWGKDEREHAEKGRRMGRRVKGRRTEKGERKKEKYIYVWAIFCPISSVVNNVQNYFTYSLFLNFAFQAIERNIGSFSNMLKIYSIPLLPRLTSTSL